MKDSEYVDLTPHLFTAFVMAAFVIGVLVSKSCEREKSAEPRTISQHETARQKQIAADSIAREEWAADTLKTFTRFKARERVLDSLASELPRQREKAQHSANTYAKTPTLTNCQHALKDCQHENETQRYALGVQGQQLSEYEQAQKADRKEIARSHAAADSSFAGWGQANADLSKSEAMMKKEQGKRFVLSAGVGYGLTPQGLQPNVSVQVGYVIKRF